MLIVVNCVHKNQFSHNFPSYLSAEKIRKNFFWSFCTDSWLKRSDIEKKVQNHSALLYVRSLNWQSLCPSVCPFIFFVCRFSIQSLQHVSVNIYYVGLINQLPVCLSVFRSICPPIRLSVCPFKCPSYCLSTRPFFHFSITNWSLTQFNVFIQRKRNT